MSQDVERVYTINLGKVLLSQSQHRAVRAINMIKEFARHHMKTDSVKIEEELAHKIWAKGVRSPPRKIRVRMSKTDNNSTLVSLYDEVAESKIQADAKDPKTDALETAMSAYSKTGESKTDAPEITINADPETGERKTESPAAELEDAPKAPEPQAEQPKAPEPKTESPQEPEAKTESESPKEQAEPKTPEPKTESSQEPKAKAEPAKEEPAKDAPAESPQEPETTEPAKDAPAESKPKD